MESFGSSKTTIEIRVKLPIELTLGLAAEMRITHLTLTR